MLSLGGDEDYTRPVGAGTPTGRRGFGLRQIISAVLVLGLGGALGTGAYFLSDFDARELIGFLDVGDPEGPHLKLPLPGHGDTGEAKGSGEAKAGGELLTPPKAGNEAAPMAEAKPTAEAKPAATTKPHAETPATEAPAKEAMSAESAPAAKIPAATAEPTESAPGQVAPSQIAVAVPTQPTPRPAAKPPAFADLPARADLKPLAAAPLKDLQHDSHNGPLPVVSADGRQAWKLYGRPFQAPAGAARVAVVVTDLGLDQSATEAAISRLPPDVSLAFSPYAQDLAKWLKKARDAGHEVLITLPSEPSNPQSRDPGPLALLGALPPQDNVGRLETMLISMPVVVGIAVTPDSAFATTAQMAPIMAALLQRGLLYVGPGAHGPRSPAAASVTEIIDRDPYRDAIDARLDAGLASAKAQGSAVLLASARPVTFERLAAFLAGLSAKGAVAAPVSAVVGVPGRS